jgi:cardiolipin synthase
MTMSVVKSNQNTAISNQSASVNDGCRWESENIYSSGQEYFDGLLIDIDYATSSIELAVYIFSLGDLGQRVVSALERAAERNVRVRLMVDGVGSAVDAETIAEQLTIIGAEVRIYHPLPWYWGNYRWSLRLGDGLQKFVYFIASMNRRDHRKFCVIDQQTVWCGSFNISQDHLKQETPWRDYGVRLTGEVSIALVESFNSIWFSHKNRKTTYRVSNLFRSNVSRRLRRLSNRLLVERIRNARSRVWICSAYFAPSGAVIRAIKVARARELDVRIIVAGRSDVPLFPILSATYFTDLLKIGVEIYSYQSGVLHAKAMLVDEQCLIGSTNLNHRSFLHDLELDVLLSSADSVERLKLLLEQDMANSLILSLDNVSKWGRYVLFGWILRLMRYWM